MGRKVSQASVKISKDDKQQQFNSLIKVLRPKVYITDSSSFKKLVQELTGNGSPTTLCPPSLEPNVVENYPFMVTESQRNPETSVDVSVSPEATSNSPESCYVALMNETSVDVSVSPEAPNYSPELCYDALMNEEFNQVCDQLCLDDLVFHDSVANQSIDHLANQSVDHLANQSIDHLLAYQNLESLLFEVEPNPLYNCYEQITEQPDVSIYDYELSGLL